MKNRYSLNKVDEDKYLGLLSAFIDKLDNFTVMFSTHQKS